MTTSENYLLPNLDAKTRAVLSTMSAVSGAKDENEAILAALVGLEQLKYPHAMISFLRRVNGRQEILAEREYATGEFRWVAEYTRRAYPGPDLLAKVLQRQKPRFILDSRDDEENDRRLCNDLSIITQYAVPLFTPTMPIGTLQILMGELHEEPKDELRILDALGAHLSITIERHRTLERLEVVQDDLMRQTKMIVHAMYTLRTVHGLYRPARELITRIEEALRITELRSNKPAYEFLRSTKTTVEGWRDQLQEALASLDRNEEIKPTNVAVAVQHTVDTWWRTAKRRDCALRAENEGEDMSVKVAPGDLMESLSCLISNSIEANAREIVVSARRRKTDDAGGDCIELAVSDNGDGIAECLKADILKFGYTSKGKMGHGMGLTIVDLLVKKMGGTFAFRAWGKSNAEARTEVAITLPAYDKRHGGSGQ